MKKQILDFVIKENQRINENYSLLKLMPADGSKIVKCIAGQFVQVEIPDSKTTFLRRPISINYVDEFYNELWLLVRNAGEGTRHLIGMEHGQLLNIMMPLMSVFFCFTFASGIGIYWIIGSLVRTVQQLIINRHLNHMDMDAFIQKNKEKRCSRAACRRWRWCRSDVLFGN